MPIEQSREPEQFADFELAGWDSNIAGYDAAFGALARQTVEPMLDAARVTSGSRVLDVCCGPGMLTGGASKRWADATGLDFSVQAVELASRLVPKAHFQQGNAQSLPFPDASFDSVLCGYGVMHASARSRGGTARNAAGPTPWQSCGAQRLGCNWLRSYPGL